MNISSKPKQAKAYWANKLFTWIAWASIGGLALLLLAQVVFLVIRAGHILGYPYPLDYGEGPLQAQVGWLLSGTPLWQLYSDPALAPYAVINYPPVYHLACLPLAWIFSLFGMNTPEAILLSGRIISLLSAIGASVAIACLAWNLQWPKQQSKQQSLIAALLVAALFLGLPIVREWGTLMRVDMLGVSLGLWGMVLVQRWADERKVLWAAALFVLCLFVKPSLVAAPAAALVWLLLRNWLQAIRLGLLTGLSGLILLVLLNIASKGWFLTHILAANVNPWDAELAKGFWREQWSMLWPLFSAAGLGIGLGCLSFAKPVKQWLGQQYGVLLPVLYTVFSAGVAIGVGKVGAYANYFLELFAGLVWLAASALIWGWASTQQQPGLVRQALRLSSWAVPILLLGALLRYYPLWSQTYLASYGLIEGERPRRVAFGRYGIWQDLQREGEVIRALNYVNQGLTQEVVTVNAPILTDIPAVASQAEKLSLIQAFEHRQLLDAGLWDQSATLRALANGEVPLVVIDYLGNWLTPEMISLITHRYAQTGSYGSFDTYEPVARGERQDAQMQFGDLSLLGWWQQAPQNGQAYQPGERLVLTLEWLATQASEQDLLVNLSLRNSNGDVVRSTNAPLVAGALRPSQWADQPIEDLQSLVMPFGEADGEFSVWLTLLDDQETAISEPQRLTTIALAQQNGRMMGELGYFVPEPMLQAWIIEGGSEAYGPGDPIMPAVQFDDRMLQCFHRACFELADNKISRLKLGETIALSENGGTAIPTNSLPAQALLGAWQNIGTDALGRLLGQPLQHAHKVVWYSEYARLELTDAGEIRLANLGDELLQLPNGGPYRWP
jgi:hypothetical protein